MKASHSRRSSGLLVERGRRLGAERLLPPLDQTLLRVFGAAAPHHVRLVDARRLDAWGLLEGEQPMLQARHRERCDADLLTVPGAGMTFAREAVDVVRNLMLAHRTVMGRPDERYAEPDEREHAMQVGDRRRVARGEPRCVFEHERFVGNLQPEGQRGVLRIEEAMREPPVDLRRRAAERIPEARGDEIRRCRRVYRKIHEYAERRVRA
jgi:hypothetical protein